MRERCPKCGMPTVGRMPDDATYEERLCNRCYEEIEKVEKIKGLNDCLEEECRKMNEDPNYMRRFEIGECPKCGFKDVGINSDVPALREHDCHPERKQEAR